MSSARIDRRLLSWGGYPRRAQRGIPLFSRFEPLSAGNVLPRGLGRSYGDVCLNSTGALLLTANLDRFISWDGDAGIVRCEAGMSIEALLRFAVPRGWFIPVTPGTRFVSLGGALANDVHGKNHHRAGAFGRHVRCFELVRSDGSRRVCAPDQNVELFGATIGGLGLTGLVTWIELQLRPIESALIERETVPFRGLEEFLALSRGSAAGWEYTVGWLDCLSKGANFCRGIFFRGNHASREAAPAKPERRSLPLTVPFEAPAWALNRSTVRVFNALYYAAHSNKPGRELVGYAPFFYPLDGVRHWNRIYGRRGFLQFQGVVPFGGALTVLDAMMRLIVDSGRASFLAVIKDFGDLESPGWLSFPRAGVTLCLDFPYRGGETIELLHRLENYVVEAGGALYPAKDAVMTAASFRRSYPRIEEFSRFLDPASSSDFWRRVAEDLS